MNYDDYDYTDIMAKEHGYIHQSDLPDFERIKDHLNGIIEAVYETGDVGMLESCLDEVCHEFGIKIKDKHPKIIKIIDDTDGLMHWYLSMQRSIIDDLNGRGESCT